MVHYTCGGSGLYAPLHPSSDTCFLSCACRWSSDLNVTLSRGAIRRRGLPCPHYQHNEAINRCLCCRTNYSENIYYDVAHCTCSRCTKSEQHEPLEAHPLKGSYPIMAQARTTRAVCLPAAQPCPKSDRGTKHPHDCRPCGQFQIPRFDVSLKCNTPPPPQIDTAVHQCLCVYVCVLICTPEQKDYVHCCTEVE